MYYVSAIIPTENEIISMMIGYIFTYGSRIRNHGKFTKYTLLQGLFLVFPLLPAPVAFYL